MTDLVKLFVILMALGIIVLYPLGILWAVNTIFGTGVPYTITTWGAAFLLVAVFSPVAYVGNRK